MRAGMTTDTSIVRYPEGERGSDQLAVEEPVEIRVNGEPLAVTMRTPGHDPELAAGFCLTEGVVDHPDDLEHVEACTLTDYGNVILVTLADPARAHYQARAQQSRRELYLSSSCGLCGTQTLDRLARHIVPVETMFQVRTEVLSAMPSRMAEAQEAFVRTGGLHAAALFAPDGRLRLLYEDVGRHNAVDKLIGALLLSGQLPCGPGVLLVSGRASFELMQKAARAGIGFLAAVGAPSSLAVETANRFSMTLIGFLRGNSFNVYAGPERVG